jgi:hypothetical protein
MDVDFDDFADLNFALYKDVHIHAMEVYDNGAYLCGLEMYYLVDGDVMRYILHHRTKKGAAVAAKGGLGGALGGMLGGGKGLTHGKTDSVVADMPSFRKTSIYFKRKEYISKVRVSG